MRDTVKSLLTSLLLCALLPACTQSPLVETPQTPTLPTETPMFTATPAPVSAEPPALQPLPAPDPLPEGGPLTLAGKELFSAVMMDGEESYGFSAGAAANLEGWFQLLGFRAEEPFYEYYAPDGALQLILWYDPDSGTGLGIRYRDGDGYGFGFRHTGWAGRGEENERYGYGWYRWEDPYVLPKPDLSGITEYEERREEDEAGRLTRLSAYGEVDWLEDIEQPVMLRYMEYEYDEAGALRHRSFCNSTMYASTNPGMDGYYDDRGRLAYEQGYITHGSTDTYYLYEGDAKNPSYALYLDKSHQTNFPQFFRYPS